MRSRAPLALMEQMIMILIFALAAAMCMQIFVKADQKSQENEMRDMAVVLAQNAAELIRAEKGDCIVALGSDRVHYNKFGERCDATEMVYQLIVTEENNEVSGLGSAQIQVFGEEQLFALRVCWQEEEP